MTHAATDLQVQHTPAHEIGYHPRAMVRSALSAMHGTAPAGVVVARTLGRALASRARASARRLLRKPRRLRIGVDIRPFYEPLTGIGWYLHHLIHAMAKHDDLELMLFGDARVTDAGPHLHTDLPPEAEYCTFDLRGLPPSRFARSLTAGAYVLWMELAGCDVFLGANYFLPRLHSAVARRRVITVHDLTYRRFPELLQKETLDNLNHVMPREIAAADAIICVSEATRRDLLHFYEIDPRRAVAIHSGLATPAAGEPVGGLPDRYLLFVSTIEPRKNLGVLLDAFESLKDRAAYDGALVVVGRIGWKSEDIVKRMRSSRWRASIHHLDYLRPGQLATVYRQAEIFVFPSLYEGFGFPLLEAMAHGVPSITARSSSLPEIGVDATLYFDPRDSAELAGLIELAMRDHELRQELVARGRKRAGEMLWSRTAEETLKVLRHAAER
ncbi:MAG TPA: glycosyltransferase family 1 protein [Thermoanaerobaculia bacterium]|nr:glycosyltransferase family 1 protein [Thermoanaerobaculia bacterium]